MSTEVQAIQLIKLHTAPEPMPLMGILDIVDSTGRRIRCSSRLPEHHGQYHVRYYHGVFADEQDIRPFLSVGYEFFNEGKEEVKFTMSAIHGGNHA